MNPDQSASNIGADPHWPSGKSIGKFAEQRLPQVGISREIADRLATLSLAGVSEYGTKIFLELVQYQITKQAYDVATQEILRINGAGPSEKTWIEVGRWIEVAHAKGEVALDITQAFAKILHAGAQESDLEKLPALRQQVIYHDLGPEKTLSIVASLVMRGRSEFQKSCAIDCVLIPLERNLENPNQHQLDGVFHAMCSGRASDEAFRLLLARCIPANRGDSFYCPANEFLEISGLHTPHYVLELFDTVCEHSRKNNKNPRGVCNDLSILLTKKLDESAFRELKRLTPYLYESGFLLRDTLSSFNHPHAEVDWKYYFKVIKIFENAGLNPAGVPARSVEDIQLDSWEAFVRISRRINEHNLFPLKKREDYLSLVFDIAKLRESPRLLAKVEAVCNEVPNVSIDHLIRHAQEVRSYDAVTTIVGKRSLEEKQRALEFVTRTCRADSPPWRTNDPELAIAAQETHQTIRRGLDVHLGSGHLKFDARHIPGLDLSLFSRMAFDLAPTGSVQVLNCKNINLFPGRGFSFTNLDPKLIFVGDPDSADHFKLFKNALPWAQHEFEDFQGTRFVLCRGFTAITGPETPKYAINGVHYSYLVFNEHFQNEYCPIAWAIPTSLLDSLLRGTGIAIEDYVGYKPEVGDISQRGLNPLALEAKAIKGGFPILNLCSATNLGGTLCNAFPAGSEPYFEWENGNSGTRDIWNHVHKVYRFGSTTNEFSTFFDQKMKPLREAHHLVKSHAHRNQNLFDIFRIAVSLYHKGLCASDQDRATGIDDSQIDLGKSLQGEENFKAIEQMARMPSVYRMLNEAKAWRQALLDTQGGITDFPVLCLCKTLNYWHPPTPLLDTAKGIFYAGNRQLKVDLDSAELGVELKRLWRDHAIPHFTTGNDFRLIDRRDLKPN